MTQLFHSWYIPQRIENTHPHTSIYLNVRSNIIIIVKKKKEKKENKPNAKLMNVSGKGGICIQWNAEQWKGMKY